MTADPSGGLRNPKQPKRLPKMLKVDDVIKLLDGLPTGTPFGVRDRAMFETLYGGGLRVSELVGLNLDDLDLESQLLRVARQGKTRAALPRGADRLRLDRTLGSSSPAQATRRTGAVSQSLRRPSHHAERRPIARRIPRPARP